MLIIFISWLYGENEEDDNECLFDPSCWTADRLVVYLLGSITIDALVYNVDKRACIIYGLLLHRTDIGM